MREATGYGLNGKRPSPFSVYLRSGRRISSQANCDIVEFKFNPNHDPKNGQFTFDPGGVSADPLSRRSASPSAGRATPKAKPAKPAPKSNGSPTWGGPVFGGGGGGDFGGAGATGYYLTSEDVAKFKKTHPGMKPRLLLPGDTLVSVAREHGLSGARLAALNHISIEAQLRPGDVLAIPAGSKPKHLAPSPVVRHDVSVTQVIGKPVPYRHIVKNGYDFAIDGENRTREIDGVLSTNPKQVRNQRAQREAGGADRLATDHGGHYIARRFNGPTDAFNHFAQDGTFNKGRYAALENKWAQAQLRGEKVYVRIVPLYPAQSKRPSEIFVSYSVDSKQVNLHFPNRGGVK